jgi:hypothetical protein
MKFKVDDKIKSIAGINQGKEGVVLKIDEGDPITPYYTTLGWKMEGNIVLIPDNAEKPVEIRQFETGATRDSDDHPEKPNYYAALSPIVLREYVKYLGRHRTMADGTKRNWDNWKSGIPIDVYMEGLMRHTMAVWLIQQGFKSYDNHGEVTLKDSLNGVLFNTIGHLHEILKAEVERYKDEQK